MGAIARGTQLLDRNLIRALRIPDVELKAAVARETEEMKRREGVYTGERLQIPLAGHDVVIVDDGFATGSTMIAAARHVRGFHPRKLIVAVPVGQSEACMRLRSESDECVCLAQPEPFHAVGAWYIDFQPVTNSEVQSLLELRMHVG